MDANHDSLEAISSLPKTSRASRSIESSIASLGSIQDDARWCGVGLGAGVGGDAGAEGSSGFGPGCDIADGKPVLGVGGGLGCECRSEVFRGGCPTVT
jgi:hypothetical protein